GDHADACALLARRNVDRRRRHANGILAWRERQLNTGRARRDRYRLKSRRGNTKLVIIEQRGHVEIEVSAVVGDLLSDDSGGAERSHLRARDWIAGRIKNRSLYFRGARRGSKRRSK